MMTAKPEGICAVHAESRIAVPTQSGRLALRLSDCDGVMVFSVDPLRQVVLREEFVQRTPGDDILLWLKGIKPQMLFVKSLTPRQHVRLTEQAIFVVPGIEEPNARKSVSEYLCTC